MPLGGYLNTVFVVLGGAIILLVGYRAISSILQSASSSGHLAMSENTVSASSSNESPSTPSEHLTERADSATQKITSTPTDAADHSDSPSTAVGSLSTTARRTGDGTTSSGTDPREAIQEDIVRSRATQSTRTIAARTRRTNSAYRTPPEKRRSPSRSDNHYFKIVDSDGTIRFIDFDRTASILDVDYGPEFFDFSLIPDLIEADIGPSAMSEELVQSPVEFKISSFIKALLTPPQSNGSAPSNESAQPAVTHRPTQHRTVDALGGREGTNPPSQESSFHGDGQFIHQPLEGVNSPEKDNGPVWECPEALLSRQREKGDYTGTSLDAFSLEDRSRSLIGGSDQPLPEMESLSVENQCFTQEDMGIEEEAFEPVPDVEEDRIAPDGIGVGHSSADKDQPRWYDIAPSGGEDVLEPMFSQPSVPDEPLGDSFPVSSYAALDFGAEQFGRESHEPIMDHLLETGHSEEMWRFDQGEAGANRSVGLPEYSAEEVSDPWPSVTGFGSDGDIAEGWLSF